MFVTEEERTKIVREIHTTANKVVQEKYMERVKQIVKQFYEETGEDISELVVSQTKKK